MFIPNLLTTMTKKPFLIFVFIQLEWDFFFLAI
jgi:hypothetical protein